MYSVQINKQCKINSKIVHVAKPDVVNTTIRHCARSYDIRLPVVLTVHVVKPDGVQTD